MPRPAWMLGDRGLTDFDFRLLSYLDYKGWLQGDGRVAETCEEIGEFFGKNEKTIRRSLSRIVEAHPGLIEFESASRYNRSAIILRYDRYGRDVPETARGPELDAGPAPDAGQECPADAGPMPGKNVRPSRAKMSGQAGQKCPAVPIKEFEELRTTSTEVVEVVANSGLAPITTPQPPPDPSAALAALEAAPLPPIGDDEWTTIPTTVDQLESWVDLLVGDDALTRSVPILVALAKPHAKSKAIEWVMDACSRAALGARQDDEGNASYASYANGCLQRWIQAGGRPIDVEEAEARRLAEAARPAADAREAEKLHRAEEARQQKILEDGRKARWGRLPTRERDAIESAVLEANPHARKFGGLFLESLCLEEMEARADVARARSVPAGSR